MTESNLIAHANRELDLLGFPPLTRAQMRSGQFPLTDGGQSLWIRRNAIQIIETFAKQGHSGASAAQVVFMVHKLLQYKPLSPITDNPEDWPQVDPAKTGGIDMWQCRRNSAAMSHDGGKTYYFVDEYTRWAKVLKKLPAGALRRWVWSHRNWMHPIHKAVQHGA